MDIFVADSGALFEYIPCPEDRWSYAEELVVYAHARMSLQERVHRSLLLQIPFMISRRILNDIGSPRSEDFSWRHRIHLIEVKLFQILLPLMSNRTERWQRVEPVTDSIAGASQQALSPITEHRGTVSEIATETQDQVPNLRVGKVCARDRANVCTVCMEKFRFSRRKATLKCGHIFHYTCILACLQQSRLCPNCRMAL